MSDNSSSVQSKVYGYGLDSLGLVRDTLNPNQFVKCYSLKNINANNYPLWSVMSKSATVVPQGLGAINNNYYSNYVESATSNTDDILGYLYWTTTSSEFGQSYKEVNIYDFGTYKNSADQVLPIIATISYPCISSQIPSTCYIVPFDAPIYSGLNLLGIPSRTYTAGDPVYIGTQATEPEIQEGSGNQYFIPQGFVSPFDFEGSGLFLLPNMVISETVTLDSTNFMVRIQRAF